MFCSVIRVLRLAAVLSGGRVVSLMCLSEKHSEAAGGMSVCVCVFPARK